MKSYRLNRLFNPLSKKCFDVAIDHGLFNECEFLKGVENIRSVVNTIVDAGPDAIQLSPGQLKYLQKVARKQKPSLVLRTDVANVYGAAPPSTPFSKVIAAPVLQAVQADAACVCVNLFSTPGVPEIAAQCIDNIMQIKKASDHYCMPLMIETLVLSPEHAGGGYRTDGNILKIIPLVRQAVELGADIIKADPCEEINDYHRVIEIAGEIPVLVRGGGKIPDKEIIDRTVLLMEQGASGIVYGRNIIQHEDPALITRVLMEIVHEGRPRKDALAALNF